MKKENTMAWKLLEFIGSSGDKGKTLTEIQLFIWTVLEGKSESSFWEPSGPNNYNDDPNKNSRKTRGHWNTALYGGPHYHSGLLHQYCEKTDHKTWMLTSMPKAGENIFKKYGHKDRGITIVKIPANPEPKVIVTEKTPEPTVEPEPIITKPGNPVKYKRFKGDTLPQIAIDMVNSGNGFQYGGNWTEAYYLNDGSKQEDWIVVTDNGNFYKVGATYMTWWLKDGEVIGKANWSLYSLFKTIQALKAGLTPPEDKNYQS